MAPWTESVGYCHATVQVAKVLLVSATLFPPFSSLFEFVWLDHRVGGEGGEGRELKSVLSIPSKPEASTKPRADRAKLSRSTALAATVGNIWLAWTPPMERTTRR